MGAAYRFGAFELQPEQRRLLMNGSPAAIGPRAFDVLLALVERAGQLVSKSELLDLVWPGLVVEENNLQVQISALRRLLGPQAIATIPGRGYRWALAVEDRSTMPRSQSVPSPMPESLAPTDAASGLPALYGRSEELAALPSLPIAAVVDAGPLSIVVLPFRNLTGDANQTYVADGLTASLTSDLSRIRDTFIINAATAFAYKDKPLTAQQVGRELGVHFVLHGSVQRSDTRIRINAQLADAASNAQLWSESFEGDLSDLFALQDRVTTLVCNSIGREMVIVAARESETRKTSSKVADLMLRARALDLKPASLKNRQQVEDLYRQALAQEPNNSSAMAALAMSLVLQVDNFPTEMDEGVKEKKMVEGRDLALMAKELDPDNPSISVVIFAYALHHGDLTGARRASEIRLSLRPKDPIAYLNLAYTFVQEGEPRRAIELLTQAINLDPKHPHEFVLHLMGSAYLMLGDNNAAIEWFVKALERNPSFGRTFTLLAIAYASEGDDAKVRAAATEARRLDPNTKLSTFEGQRASSAIYKEWFESKLVPAWRKAGLPE